MLTISDWYRGHDDGLANLNAWPAIASERTAIPRSGNVSRGDNCVFGICYRQPSSVITQVISG